jgi:E3 ubiquitin-protein ligase UBR4
VETGPYAGSFKDLAIERNVIDSCLEYISIRAPSMKPPFGQDSEEWKDMASKPALKYVLRLLAGFATGHSASQVWPKLKLYRVWIDVKQL